MRKTALAFTLVLAGCGGGDGGDSVQSAGTTTGISDKQPTKQQYLARGDAVCADAQADLSRLGPKIEAAAAAEGDDKARLVRDVWREQLVIFDSFSGRIKALGAPAGDEPQVREFVRSLDEGRALAGRIVDELEAGEEPSQSLIDEYSQTAYRGNTLAQAYGFKVCGRTG